MIIKKIAALAFGKLTIVGVAVSCALYFKEEAKEAPKSETQKQVSKIIKADDLCNTWDCLDSDYKSTGF